ncbi:MAG: cyclic nucleotide-binding domain-containing protein [Gammaproteobacteria bacterium]|nr:cyclic nucleotide-binding domain-containing protein [Gammaproteobacteria bacterium]
MTEAASCEAVIDSVLGQELEDDQCLFLASVMKVKKLSDGEYLVQEGDADNHLFILTAGKLVVSSLTDGKQKDVYKMKVGECAGTRAFVDRAPRQASLRAEGSATVYTLDPNDFESLLAEHADVVYKVMRGLFRLTHMNLMRMNTETQELSNYINKTGGRY